MYNYINVLLWFMHGNFFEFYYCKSALKGSEILDGRERKISFLSADMILVLILMFFCLLIGWKRWKKLIRTSQNFKFMENQSLSFLIRYLILTILSKIFNFWKQKNLKAFLGLFDCWQNSTGQTKAARN